MKQCHTCQFWRKTNMYEEDGVVSYQLGFCRNARYMNVSIESQMKKHRIYICTTADNGCELHSDLLPQNPFEQR